MWTVYEAGGRGIDAVHDAGICIELFVYVSTSISVVPMPYFLFKYWMVNVTL